MGWYAEEWGRRFPLSVDIEPINRSGTGNSDDDCVFEVPTGWDEFWDNVNEDGDDIRFTKTDGYTEIDYYLSAWDYASRTATIHLEDPYTNTQITNTIGSGIVQLLLVWIYWDHEDDTATAVSASFTLSTNTAQAYVYWGQPSGRVHSLSRPTNGTRPDIQIDKTEDAAFFVWLELSDLFMRSVDEEHGRNYYEGPLYAQSGQHRSGGVNDSTFSSIYVSRWAYSGDRLYLGIRLGSSGTDGSDYTVKFRIVCQLPLLTSTGNTQLVSNETIISHNISFLVSVREPTVS